MGDVVRAPAQFDGLHSRNAIFDTSSPVFQQVAANVGPILNGVDGPTTDATHFYSGSSVPAWAVGRPAQNIGGNNFVNLGGSSGAVQATPQDQSAGATSLDESLLGGSQQPADPAQSGAQPSQAAPSQAGSNQPSQSQMDESLLGPDQRQTGGYQLSSRALPVLGDPSQLTGNDAQIDTIQGMIKAGQYDASAQPGSATYPYVPEG